MFKINHELSKNPNERLLIIKKIINLNKLQGGNLEFSNTTQDQLKQITSNLYDLNPDTISENDNYSKQVIELLNNIHKYIHSTDINKIILYLYKLDVLLDKNILTDSKKYKTTLQEIIGTLENIDKKTSHKEIANIKQNLKVLIHKISEAPLLKKNKHLYLPIHEETRTKDFLISKTSTSLKQDNKDSKDSKDSKDDDIHYDSKENNEEDIESLYLSETEQNLVYMLLNTIGIKNIDTWDVISKKYKVLYNQLILGDANSSDVKHKAFRYSYNDIAFVQNLINFNYFGLIDWEIATLNIKKYINDLFLVLKGNKIEEKEDDEEVNEDDEDDSEKEDDEEVSEDDEDDSEKEDDEEVSEDVEDDSENDSEEDIEKIVSK